MQHAPINSKHAINSMGDRMFFENDLLQMSRSVNYIDWQVRLLSGHLSGRTLEIGGGIGNLTVPLSRHVNSLLSIEPDHYCFSRLKERTNSLGNVEVINTTSEQLLKILPENSNFDSIVSTNVLEHIEDDAAAVQAYCQLLKPGGNLVLTVPAGQWAYGVIDKRLGHYRRYNKKNLLSLLSKSKFDVTRIQYYNIIGLAAWFWNNRITKNTSQNNFQIHVFDKYFVPFLSTFEAIVRVPFGQSLLLVAKKHQL